MTARRRIPVSPPAATAPTAPLLTLREAAALLNVAVRTLQSWRATGKLGVVALSKRCVRVEPAEVERLIRESRS